MQKSLFAIGLALAVFSTPAVAQSFEEHDSNGDGQITKDEFYNSVSDAGIYSDVDTNGDGLIAEDEFGALGQDWDYNSWDANSDGYVDSGEFYDGYYANHDSSEDGHWDDGEWDDAGEAGLFDW